jgi:BAAT / Acyl-CoA thioester hydrolase C terminal/Acyl-CoA thioester hydrolase/BAAT N-terminal region
VRIAIVLAALLAVASACGESGRRPALVVRPASSVEDEPVVIEATGFPAGERVTLTLRSTDVDGIHFEAKAAFRADKNGSIRLDHTAPLPGGSYAGRWGMGLLASMVAPGRPTAYYYWSTEPRMFRLTATAAGRVGASATFTRRWSAVRYTTRKLTVTKDGIDGTFFAPVGARDRPAVSSFGGSEGGDDGGFTAGRLAAHGIPTLYVGYFHAPGVPDRLVDIPLEYFHRALLWLDRQSAVDRRRVSIVTGSYGSEAALLLGADYPGLMRKIVATVPSSTVTCGIVGAHRAAHKCLGSPWTLHGRPLPYTRLFDDAEPFDEPRAVIPVERIRAKLLLACGGEDATWSSCPYARAIVARRRKAGEATTLYAYPRAGHFVGSPSFAYEPGAMTSDTSVPWTERGREDLWPRVVAFVRS